MLIVIVSSTKYRPTGKFLSHTGKIIYIKGQDNTSCSRRFCTDTNRTGLKTNINEALNSSHDPKTYIKRNIKT